MLHQHGIQLTLLAVWVELTGVSGTARIRYDFSFIRIPSCLMHPAESNSFPIHPCKLASQQIGDPELKYRLQREDYSSDFNGTPADFYLCCAYGEEATQRHEYSGIIIVHLQRYRYGLCGICSTP